MIVVIRRQRRSAVLTPSALPCLRDVATVNLTAGCAHGCIYCYARSYPSYPGDGTIVFYTKTFQLMREELALRRSPPPAVYFSPSSDLFQPVSQVLEMGYDILEFLFTKGLPVAFLSKGCIPSRHMELLCANPRLVQAQIGITTLDERISTMFEPGAAPPAQRLKQLEELRSAGVRARARLDPLIPGWTDEPAALDELCRALAAAGVSQMSASALFIRAEIVRTLGRLLPNQEVFHSLLRHYPAPCAARSAAGRRGERSLAKALRERMYDSVRESAVRHGIALSICGCENPDITSERCCIAGERPDPRTGSRQTKLFAVESAKT